MEQHLTGRSVLITGGSRGVGAALAERFAVTGADVIINYRSKRPRAEAVGARVAALGRRVLLAQADITRSPEVEAMLELVRASFGSLGVLVLNASGGLERDRSGDYAMSLNRDAQVRLVELALPLMAPGGRVVFVTSHLAHFFGERPVLPEYEPVAASKQAGERALRALIPEFERRGLGFVVVSGDLIEGTITPRLLERGRPGLIEARRAEAGALPTVDEFAAAIVRAAAAPLELGATVYVGSTD